MTFTLTFAWWWIPALITVAGIIWSIFIVDSGSGWFAGVSNLMALLASLAASGVAWAIAGFLK